MFLINGIFFLVNGIIGVIIDIKQANYHYVAQGTFDLVAVSKKNVKLLDEEEIPQRKKNNRGRPKKEDSPSKSIIEDSESKPKKIKKNEERKKNEIESKKTESEKKNDNQVAYKVNGKLYIIYNVFFHNSNDFII